jgi:ubiquinone biosynthesis protein COQ4
MLEDFTVATSQKAQMADDVEYMRAGMSLESSSSILLSSSKYLNSPLIRDWICNEALRRPGPDANTIARTPEFYHALEQVFDHETTARLIREDAQRLPDLGQWLRERRLCNITAEDVRSCAPGTLGHAIKLLLDKGYKLYFGRLGEAESDFEYIRKRRAQIHDIEHIVTGFPADSIAGEVALSTSHVTVSYNYYQPRLAKETTLTSSFYISAWILRTTLHTSEVMPAVCDALQRGAELGKRLRRPLYMEPWEDFLDWQLTDLRARFDMPEQTGFVGNWDWSEVDERPAAAV